MSIGFKVELPGVCPDVRISTHPPCILTPFDAQLWNLSQ